MGSFTTARWSVLWPWRSSLLDCSGALQKKQPFLLVVQTPFQKEMMEEHGNVRAQGSPCTALAALGAGAFLQAKGLTAKNHARAGAPPALPRVQRARAGEASAAAPSQPLVLLGVRMELVCMNMTTCGKPPRVELEIGAQETEVVCPKCGSVWNRHKRLVRREQAA